MTNKTYIQKGSEQLINKLIYGLNILLAEIKNAIVFALKSTEILNKIFFRKNNQTTQLIVRLFSICSFFILISFLTISCKKTYESVPLNLLTEDYIWDKSDSNGTYASQYLTSIYARLPLTYNRIGQDFIDAASDDAVSSQVSISPAEIMATGGITVFSNPDDSWAADYTGIRMCTNFLQNFGLVPLKNPDEKKSWFGEARVMRALFYWELVRRYGGVPIIGDSIKGLKDNIELPRSSFNDCIAYIVDECDRANDSLRSDPVDDLHLGRFSKASALALKTRVLLFAASPLYNEKANGNALNGYASYDKSRWQLAAAAAKQLMDLNIYTLEPVFKNIFINQRSSEVIFAHLNVPNTSIETINGPVGFSSAPGSGNTSPTQELADVFEMSNGKAISDPASGYDATKPYTHRDPRFAATLLFNGAKWLNTSLETFDGGTSKPGGSLTQTKTGFYLRKFMGNFEDQTSYANQYHDYIFFRYAEVLLNFAEAQNEFSGPDADVYSAIESIRRRAGLSPYNLPVDLSQDLMREMIHNERRRELAFEEHRFWDIRRWKIAEQVYNKPLHGTQIIKNSIGQLSYNLREVLTTAFDASKMYFYPIPYNEVVSNKNMIQNPGW